MSRASRLQIFTKTNSSNYEEPVFVRRQRLPSLQRLGVRGEHQLHQLAHPVRAYGGGDAVGRLAEPSPRRVADVPRAEEAARGRPDDADGAPRGVAVGRHHVHRAGGAAAGKRWRPGEARDEAQAGRDDVHALRRTDERTYEQRQSAEQASGGVSPGKVENVRRSFFIIIIIILIDLYST